MKDTWFVIMKLLPQAADTLPTPLVPKKFVFEDTVKYYAVGSKIARYDGTSVVDGLQKEL